MSKMLIANSLFIFCLIFCFIFSLITFVKFDNSDYQYIASIGKNWSTGPLSDASIAAMDCPTGKVNIIEDIWHGTVTGCFCGNSLLPSGLTRNTCSRKSYCQQINEINKIQYKQWKGMNICAKRGPNYLDLKTAKKPIDCGAGYKSCGIIDSLNNVLCYPENLECPYNYIRIIDTKNENIPKDKKYSILSSSDNDIKVILSNQEPNGKVLNQFKIDDKTPCLSPDYKNLEIQPHLLEYTWDKNTCKNEVGGEFTDSTYTKIDSESYLKLYTENNIYQAMEKLPNFKTQNYLNSQTSLFYKNYVGMEKSCLNRFKGTVESSQIIRNLIEIATIIADNAKVAGIGLVFCIVGIIMVICFTIFVGCSGFDSDKLRCFYIGGLIIISLPCLVVSAILVSKTNNLNYDLSVFSEPLCTDSITSHAVQGFSSNLRAGKTNSWVYLIFSVLLMIVNIVSFF